MRRLLLFLVLVAVFLSGRNYVRLAQLERRLGLNEAAPAVTSMSPVSPAVADPEQEKQIREMESALRKAWEHSQRAQEFLRQGKMDEVERELQRIERELRPWRPSPTKEAEPAASAPAKTPSEESTPTPSRNLRENWDAFKELLRKRVQRAEERLD
ncbi:MAG TPA: hypothetical protein EYP85_04500 [Armatimonadetes bacterium]|nr:hypothetical protein [Armatimonadota bacterium]